MRDPGWTEGWNSAIERAVEVVRSAPVDNRVKDFLRIVLSRELKKDDYEDAL